MLPSFVRPRARLELSVTESKLLDFITQITSYRQIAWSDELEPENSNNSLSRTFRAVQKAARDVSKHSLELNRQLLESSPEHLLTVLNQQRNVGIFKTKTASKQRQLSLLRDLFETLRNKFTGCKTAICEAYRCLCLDFRLPTPHLVKQALF
jgi:hypothetical protein